MSSSSPFSITSLTETFTILMNTPMIPPRESDTEVPLTDMPVRKRTGALRAHFDDANVYLESVSSADASARNSFDVTQAVAIFHEAVTGHNTPPASRMPTTSRATPPPVIASPRASPALHSSVLDTTPTEAEAVESRIAHGGPSHSKPSSHESGL